MSTPVQTKVGPVNFQRHHQPTLAAGDYTITVAQKVKIDKAEVAAFNATRNFTVAGDRFVLQPADVEAVFPPEGNLGEHSNVLPHIMLSRSTLPWERTAVKLAAGDKDTGVPWLALLLFDESEKPTPKTVKAKELKEAPAAGKPKFPPVLLESWQDPEEQLTVIDVPVDVLKAILPTVDELRFLAHVRFGTVSDKEPPKGAPPEDKPRPDEMAVIIANRLPQSGKTSTMHLVSLEKRFEAAANAYQFNYQKDDPGTDLIRLVSLKSWSFACEDEKQSFKHLLLQLNTKPTTLRLPDGPQSAQHLLSQGYVVVPHYFRHGEQTVSWFRGPLAPAKNVSPMMMPVSSDDESVPPKKLMNLPARSADELVRYDPAFSMFDVSYAAAWELGRLLALQDKGFSTSLYQWKREYAQKLAQEEQRSPHLPFQKATLAFVPEDVSAWFKSLRNLEGVPFNYLVPDERMLPAESIRFFRVDRAWLDCLADGAFSIGRVASSDLDDDRSHGAKSPAAGLAPMLTGFLMRSEVVSGWPGLLVAGYSDKTGKKSLICKRMERLSKGVLLCIFAGEVARVDIHQKPEMLHFGLEKNGSFNKTVRDKNGVATERKVELKGNLWRSESTRTLDVANFAGVMSAPTSAEFAFQMVEGVENVIFVAKSGGP